MIDYYPFGSVRIDEKYSGYGNDYKFTGYELDESGLNYAGARYYDSESGRFTSVDPVYNAVGNNELLEQKTGMSLQKYLANPQHLNSYSYTINNPLKHVDENGEWIDAIVDVGFIAYDLYALGKAVATGGDVKTEAMALGADVGSIFVPGTGFGLGVRAVRNADKVGDTAKVINKVKSITPSAKNYRSVFQKSHGILRSGDIHVHHTLPKQFESIFQKSNINVHDTKYLKSVHWKAHQKITSDWNKWIANNKNNLNVGSIKNYARQIEKTYGKYFNKPSHYKK